MPPCKYQCAAALLAVTIAAPAFGEEPPVAPPAVARPSALVPLYMSFGALQVADVATTLRNVDAGATEANPLMGSLVNSPAAFVATKAALATVSIYCTEKLWKKNRAAAIALMVGLNGVSAAVVARNYATRVGR